MAETKKKRDFLAASGKYLKELKSDMGKICLAHLAPGGQQYPDRFGHDHRGDCSSGLSTPSTRTARA
jgi:hypothetical protein